MKKRKLRSKMRALRQEVKQLRRELARHDPFYRLLTHPFKIGDTVRVKVPPRYKEPQHTGDDPV